MIFPIYLNPTIDKTVYLDSFVYGGTNRVDEVLEQGGGKALNLSVVLSRLGEEVQAAGFICELNNTIILDAFGEIPTSFIEIPSGPRVNLKIVDRSAFITTEVNEKGPEISPLQLRTFDALLADILTEEDTVVLSGALPPGAPMDYYAHIISSVPCKVALDASGEALRLAVKEKPYIIKPNIEEFEQLTGKTYGNKEEIIAAARALIAAGIEICVVSLGAEGALIIDSKEAYYAAPVVSNPDSTVGAGDSMLAGILYELTEKNSIADAIKMGTAAAGATITLPGTALASAERIYEFLPKVVVEKI
ncbi:MAG: 1-phosphofructokinase family hexose kinase [Christensenellaceae bacterium]|jgi:1-phosphofructokinase